MQTPLHPHLLRQPAALLICLLLITACRKNTDAGQHEDTALYRQWLAQQPAGIKEQLTVYNGGQPVTGCLHWQQAYHFTKGGYAYTSVPYYYTIRGKKSRFINGAKTAMVFRRSLAGGPVQARYTTSSRSLQQQGGELQAGYDNVIYYTLDGRVDEVWFTEAGQSHRMRRDVFAAGLRAATAARGTHCLNFTITYTTVQYAVINGVYGPIITIHTQNLLFCYETSDELLEPDDGSPDDWGSGGGGIGASGPPPEPATDPCPTANQTAQSPVFNNNMNILKTSAAIDTVEKGFYCERSATGSLYQSGIFTGTANNLHVDIIVPPYTYLGAIMHSHPAGGLSIFSDADFYEVFTLYNEGKISNPQGFSSTVVTAGGTSYMLAITDISSFQAKAQEFSDPVLGKAAFYAAFEIAHLEVANTPEMNERNLINFLKFAKLGVTILRNDSNNFDNWKKLTLDGSLNVTAIPCN